MRLLVLNANTTDAITAKVATEARRVAAPDTEIVPVTGTFGGRVIGTRTENALGEHSAVALGAEHAAGCDGVLIAVSYDTGLRALRELLPIPAVGMTEAALLCGCMVAGRIGVIVFGSRVLALYRELVDSYALAGRIAGWRAIDNAAAYTGDDQHELEQQILRAIHDLVERDHAEAVLLSGAVMAGVPRRLQSQAPVPLLDGIDCGVRQVELMVRLGLPKPTVGSYAPPPARELVGVNGAIGGWFGGAKG